MANELALNRINLSLKWFIIPSLILLGLAIGLGLLYSEKWTILIFAVVFVVVAIFAEPYLGAMFYLICLYARPMEIISAVKGMPIMKFLAIGTLGIWLLRMLIIRDRKFVKAPQNYLMIAFIIVMSASMRTYVTGIVNVLTGDFFKIIVIYFLLINLVNTERRLYATIWIIILSTLWLSIHSILLSRGIVIGDIRTLEGSRVAGSGIFSDPNDLAQAIVVAIPFVFNLFFHGRFVLNKIILAVIGAVMMFAFLLTGSRGGFIGLSVVMFLIIRRKTGIILGAVISIICLVGLLAFAPDYMIKRLETASPYEGTGAGRIEIWYEGWQMFLSNPILGIGMNNYAEYQSTHHVAHNSFVHVATELGLPGLVIWIGLLYFSFKALNETRKLYSSEVADNDMFLDKKRKESNICEDLNIPHLAKADNGRFLNLETKENNQSCGSTYFPSSKANKDRLLKAEIDENAHSCWSTDSPFGKGGKGDLKSPNPDSTIDLMKKPTPENFSKDGEDRLLDKKVRKSTASGGPHIPPLAKGGRGDLSELNTDFTNSEADISKAHVLSDSLIVSMIGFLSTAFFLSRQYEYLPYILIGLSVVVYQIANKDKGLWLKFPLRELRNILLATLAFLIVWVGILKVFL